MSWKSRKGHRKGQAAAARKITRQLRGLRKEISQLTKERDEGQKFLHAYSYDLSAANRLIQTFAYALDSRGHRFVSSLRRACRMKAEIPRELLPSMKGQSA